MCPQALPLLLFRTSQSAACPRPLWPSPLTVHGNVSESCPLGPLRRAPRFGSAGRWPQPAVLSIWRRADGHVVVTAPDDVAVWGGGAGWRRGRGGARVWGRAGWARGDAAAGDGADGDSRWRRAKMTRMASDGITPAGGCVVPLHLRRLFSTTQQGMPPVAASGKTKAARGSPPLRS